MNSLVIPVAALCLIVAFLPGCASKEAPPGARADSAVPEDASKSSTGGSGSGPVSDSSPSSSGSGSGPVSDSSPSSSGSDSGPVSDSSPSSSGSDSGPVSDSSVPSPGPCSGGSPYDTWAATGSMGTSRMGHAVVVLPSGKALVVGGVERTSDTGGYIATSSADIYSPATGSWSPTGSMGSAREGHVVILLPNGKVLAAGGGGASAEIYDPAAESWVSTREMTLTRIQAAAALLPGGGVLVTGGACGGGLCHWIEDGKTAEIYDPDAGTWTRTGSMNEPRSRHTAIVLHNGKVLVFGGANADYTNILYDSLASADLFDPTEGTWTNTGSLTTGRLRHTATLLSSGKVLVAGGEDCAIARAPGAPAAFESCTPLASAEIYDPDTGTWSSTTSMSTARTQATSTLLCDGRVLVAGGRKDSGMNQALASAEIFDPTTEEWTPTASMRTTRQNHATVLLPNGRVLVSGGNENAFTYSGKPFLSTAELY